MAKKNTMAKAKATAAKLQRYATTLTDPAGNKLTAVAAELKGGKFRSALMHRVDKKSQRGMVEMHSTFNDAKARVERLTNDAKTNGWQAKERKVKVPAFTSIPKPTTKPTTKPAPLA